MQRRAEPSSGADVLLDERVGMLGTCRAAAGVCFDPWVLSLKTCNGKFEH
jgi:hypothetical protein